MFRRMVLPLSVVATTTYPIDILTFRSVPLLGTDFDLSQSSNRAQHRWLSPPALHKAKIGHATLKGIYLSRKRDITYLGVAFVSSGSTLLVYADVVRCLRDPLSVAYVHGKVMVVRITCRVWCALKNSVRTPI